MSDAHQVLEVLVHGPGIRELVLERAGLAFTPGDCVAMFGADGTTSRPYSIASGTDEAVLRFLVRRVDGGQVSPYLCGRRPGDRVKMSPPFGWFRPASRAGRAPLVYLATGTGVAPFLSSLRSQPGMKPDQVLYGVRYLADGVDVPWLQSRCNLRLAVSREHAEGFHHGRITDLLGEMPRAPATQYYLCGLDTMIDEVTAWLEAREVPITRIHRECFFNASFDQDSGSQTLTTAGEGYE